MIGSNNVIHTPAQQVDLATEVPPIVISTIQDNNLDNVPTLNIVHVMGPLGDDDTGLRGDMRFPFETIQAAKAAAQSGDLIKVWPWSSYDVSDVSGANGLSKEGVNYLYLDAQVTKDGSNSGPIHSDTGLTSGGRIFGTGRLVKTGGANTASAIEITRTGNSAEYFSCTSTQTYPTVSLSGQNVSLRGQETSNTGGAALESYFASGMVWMPIIKSTGGAGVISNTNQDNSNLVVNGITIEAATRGVDGGGGIFNVRYIYGPTSSYRLLEGLARLVLNTGQISKIEQSGGNSEIFLNGSCINLTISNGTFKGGYVHSATQTGGNVETTFRGGQGLGTNVYDISGGKANIKCEGLGTVRGRLNQTGGELTIIGDAEQDTNNYYAPTYSNGGKLRFMGFFSTKNAPYFIHVDGGELDLGNSRIEMLETGYTASNNSAIKYTSGKIISNGARLIMGTDTQAPIEAAAGSLEAILCAASINTNVSESIFAARKQKFKYTVQSVAEVSITLNATPLVESDTATYSTTALLAQQVAALINGAGLPVTATQDTPGTDEYFYVEANVAGTAFTSGVINLTEVVVRANGQAISNPTSVTPLQNANIV